MKILTCNILNSEFECKPEYIWEKRKEFCIEQIKEQNADIFGVQECSNQQYDDFKTAFTDYENYGMKSGQHKEGSPTEAIFFRKDLFKCIDSGGYLLDDETGYIANWVKLCNLSNNFTFIITNTHLIWGKNNKRLAQIAKIIFNTNKNNLPQILFGDFNTDITCQNYR